MEGSAWPAKLRPRNETPPWNLGFPDTPFPSPWRGASRTGQSPKGPQPSRGRPAPVPAPLARRAAAPPPAWYLHLSHICKLLSCPRLVTAEPSATDLAPLIFPPKSILHFPLIIRWLLSELSLLPGLLQPKPVSLERLPLQPKPLSQGHGEHLGVGWGLFSAASLWPGSHGKKCRHPLPLWKTEPSEPSFLPSTPHPPLFSCLPTLIHLRWFQDPKPAP